MPDGTVFSAEEMKKLLAERDAELTKAIDEARVEIKAAGKISTDTAAQLDKVSKDHMQLTDALAMLEQKLAKPAGGGAAMFKSLGNRFVDSDEFKAALKAGHGEHTGKIEFKGSFFDAGGYNATAILNTTGQNQPLVPQMQLPNIIRPQDRAMTIRDLLPVGQTVSNLIQYAKENLFTSAAAPIYDASPGATEGVLKPESSLTFTMANAPVQTIGHWIPASNQVLDDAPMLQSYIDDRLRYGLKLVEETQLLNGDGTGANLNGLMTQASTYNRGATGDTQLDTLRKAILQARIAEYPVDGIVLNPIDWANIELLKDGENRYLIGDPRNVLGQRVWGRNVVDTNSMTAANFLVGAFQLGAQIWDRMSVTVEVARQHADFFVRNMVAILCEERIALTVYRPTAFIKGTL